MIVDIRCYWRQENTKPPFCVVSKNDQVILNVGYENSLKANWSWRFLSSILPKSPSLSLKGFFLQFCNYERYTEYTFHAINETINPSLSLSAVFELNFKKYSYVYNGIYIYIYIYIRFHRPFKRHHGKEFI